MQRRFALFLVVLMTFFVASLSSGTLARSAADVPPDVPSPSLADLNAAISGAQGYLDGLYKPIDDNTATEAEYYAFPLRVYLSDYQRWLLVGEDEFASCSHLTCARTTEIRQVVNLPSSESFVVDFRSPAADASPRLKVSIDWNHDRDQYSVTVTNAEFRDAQTRADVYLYDDHLGTFDARNVGASTTQLFAKTDRSHLRSFRYTIRHGNQEAQNYYWYKGNLPRFQALARFAEDYGFRLDFDVHAPIWGHGTAYDDLMPYDTDAQDGNDAYHDCQAKMPANALSYPYESKICHVGTTPYAMVSATDPLTTAIQAIHILNKYGDANRSYQDLFHRELTPSGVAEDLEKKFEQTGVGVPSCTPAGCDGRSASGIRTFEFGALETLLGYELGRPDSRKYADAVASLVLRVQVPGDGLIQTAQGTAYERPAAAGSFYLGWDPLLRYRLDKSVVYTELDATFNMPNEYEGILASNMETTHDAYAFLTLYRCEKYGVGCPSAAPKPSDAAPAYRRHAG